MVGRSPDYLNTIVMAWADHAGFFGQKGQRFADNVRAYYRHCRDRDLFLTPAAIGETFAATFPASEVAADAERVAGALRRLARSADRVWVDLDCDAFDPAYLPAVQEPLPFGLAPPAFLKLLDAVWSEKVVGLSVSEFDPGRDVRDTSLNLLGWLLEYVLLRRYEGVGG